MEIHFYELTVILDVTSIYKLKVCNNFYDLIMKAINFDKVVIITVNSMTE